MKVFTFLTICFLFCFRLAGQTIYVQPYIQNISTNTVNILWETSSGTESTVLWGTTSALGNSSSGTTTSGITTAIIHDTYISGLLPDTRYFYKVKTGVTESDTFSFKTLPLRSSDPTIRIVAISDCQYDAAQPTKLFETVNTGIIDFCTSNYGSSNIEDLLNFCLLVGDNVNSGPTISQWRDEFFANIRNLGSSVCLLPVIGNHEANSSNYFAYFNLPTNGASGYEEHCYYKDIANTRIIGFDSNTGYQTSTQLSWLSSTLNQTASNDSIDFVIFQEHHPYLSELWLPGETDYARQVLDSLQTFNLQCGKPVVFLFGHTHAYSRGQMKDSKVLQINAATASGYIDTWGSTSQADYPDFNMSFDEYGFTLFEISSGNDPQMIIRRITRGDPAAVANNVLQDSILLRPSAMTVDAPVCIFPIDSLPVNPACVCLHISSFFAASGDSAGAVEYQLSTDPVFAALDFQIWKHTENWYFDVNTLAADTLYKQMVSNLNPNATYYWRARYRSRNLDWSPWSQRAVFTTSASSSSGNLLINQGAENDISNWTVSTGILESLSDGECAGTSPHSGTYYFGIGGLCTESVYARAFQDIDISSYAALVDNGDCIAIWGGWLSDYAGMDIPSIRIAFLDAAHSIISNCDSITSNSTSWQAINQTNDVPVGTRFIRFFMSGSRNAGTDNDSYVDDLYLEITTSASDCYHYSPGVGILNPSSHGFNIFPVPAHGSFSIAADAEYKNAQLLVFASDGSLVLETTWSAPSQEIDCSHLPSGIYFVSLIKPSFPLIHGKLLIQ